MGGGGVGRGCRTTDCCGTGLAEAAACGAAATARGAADAGPQAAAQPLARIHRQEGLDDEDGGAWLGHVRRHVAAPLGQHCVDGGDAVCEWKRWQDGRRLGAAGGGGSSATGTSIAVAAGRRYSGGASSGGASGTASHHPPLLLSPLPSGQARGPMHAPAGVWISTKYTGSIRRGVAMRKAE